MIGCLIGHEHVAGKKKPDDTGTKTEHQQDATYEFETRDKVCVESWKWDIQAGEESGDFLDVVQLTPACLSKLKSPIKAHRQQHGERSVEAESFRRL